MNMNLIEALRKLYPQVVSTIGDVAYDANGNEVAYDLKAVTAKIAQDEADKVAAEQAQATAKASALAKLTALGLTQDEVKALVG
jgi:hypothetical protein